MGAAAPVLERSLNSRCKEPAFRSKYEERVWKNAKADGLKLEYEPIVIGYAHPVHRGKCSTCGATNSVTRPASYTPDFMLKNGTFVETKGKFTPANRTRMLALRAARPDIVVRILFMRDNWLTKKHVSKYSDWAQSAGYEYAIGDRIPVEWTK